MQAQNEDAGFSAGGANQLNEQLIHLLTEAPGPIALLRGRNGVCEVCNPQLQKLWGGANQLHQPMRKAWPHLEGKGIFEMVEGVFDTGQPYHQYSYASIADWGNDGKAEQRYFDLVYSPYRNDLGETTGVIIMGLDVTAKTTAHRQLAEQQLLFKDITDAAGTALWTVDTKGNIIFVNQTWIDWTGRPYKAHLGRGWIDFVLPEDRECVISSFIRDVNHKSQFHVDFRVLRKDKRVQWVAATGKPRYSVNGEFAGYVGSCMDITDRKKAEQLLRDSEERFRNIADSAPVLIWMTGTDKQITFVNKSWTEFAGVSQLVGNIGHLHDDLLYPDDQAMVVNSYIQAFDARQEFYLEYRMRNRNDKYRWIGMKGIPRLDPDGTFEGYIGSGMDITEMKEHEQVKNDFIGMASHELKTPITSIKAYVQLLLTIYSKKTDDEFLLRSLNTVNKQINKLTRLITDLLDVSKMESGRLSLNSIEFDLHDLIKETVDEVQHTATQHDILYTSIGPLTVYADRDRIAQVITNFLTNGIKYSPDSDRVDVVVSADEQAVTIAVRDYGIGINPEEQAKVFNRFYRVEGRNEQTFSGFGIGLYVAAEIVRRHGGNVWVESEKGTGSVFYFTLPLFKDFMQE
jgi:PAS domain S-box-containing protein